MRTIVLATHGAPPNDFPRDEMAEFFALHARLEHAGVADDSPPARRYAELEAKMRAWPRSQQNDPFHAASQQIAEQLALTTGHEVIVGCNEFCAPTLDEALERAARLAHEVIVVTPMMTRGGEHAERDIPAAIERARQRRPQVTFHYAWPFDNNDIASFLAAQIASLKE